MTVVGILVALICLTLAYIAGRFHGREDRKNGLHLPFRREDPLLREAEAEVEALLAAMPPEEQQEKRPLLLPPKIHRNPRLTEIQQRAIAGLFQAGFAAHQIRRMIVEGIEPRHGQTRAATVCDWHGTYYIFTGKPASGEGEWSKPTVIPDAVWPYLRRVVENLPEKDHSWVFQYDDGKSVTHADIIACVGDEHDAQE